METLGAARLGPQPFERRLRPTPLGLWLAGLLLSSLVFAALVPSAFGLISGLVAVLLPLAAALAWRNLGGLRVGLSERLTTTAGARTPVEFAISLERRGAARDVQLILLPAGGAQPGLVAHAERVERGAPARSVGRLRWGQRGRLRRVELRVSSTFPAGLFEARCSYRLEVDHVVQPRVLRSAELAAAVQSLLGDGRVSLAGRPRGDELHGIEPWRPGMATSRVVWKLSARHPDLQQRRTLGPDLPRVLLEFDPVLRVGESRGARRTFEFGVVLFASLAASLLARGARLSVDVGDGGGPRRLQRGRGDLPGLLRALAEVEPREGAEEPLAAAPPPRGSRALRVHFGRPRASAGGRAVEIDASRRSARRLLPRVAGLIHVESNEEERP